MRQALIAITVFWCATGGVAAQSAAEREDLAQWTNAVLAHQPGSVSAKTREIGGWEWYRLKPVIAQVRSRGSARVLLKAAAMYLDLAVQVPHARRPIYPTTGLAVYSRDGRPISTQGLDSQIWWGRILVITALGRGRSSEQTRELAGIWFRTVTAGFSQRLNFADLHPHLTDASKHLPDDPGLLFDAGCAAETLASPLLQATLRSRLPQDSGTGGSSGGGTARTDTSTFLRDAEKKYRAARRAMPEDRETQVRLGRVLSLMGRYDEALTQLRSAVGGDDDLILDYFNWLFLGDVLSHTRRFDEAVAAFERAAALYPQAGAPQLGISRVHSEAGSPAAARTALANLIRTPPTANVDADPRWYYDRCTGRKRRALYARFVERFTQELR